MEIRSFLTKLSLVIAESALVEVKGKCYPCVILLGRDENFNRLKYRLVYFPYFYLLDKDYQDLVVDGFFDKMHVQTVDFSCTRNLMKKLVTKVTVQDAGRIGENIKMINKWNKQKMVENLRTIFTYEADLSKPDLLPLRYLIDMGIKCGFNIDKDKITPIEFEIPLRKWYIDFEAYTVREYSSGLNLDEPLIMVSIWDTYEEKLYTYYVVNEHWKPKLQLADFLKPRTDIKHEVKKFKSESQFLDAIMALLIKLDPDIVIAWNLNRYDLPKWKQRCEVNLKKCLYPFRDISPLKTVLMHHRPIRVKGRVMFDLMVAFKQFTDAEMDSYSLAYVTESENLGIEKTPFTGTSANTWDNYPEVMFKRNIGDVLIMKALDEKYGLVDIYDESRKEFGCLFHETFVRHRVIDTALMRMVHGKVVLGTTSYTKEEDERLLGAIVVEPVKGDYYNVAQLDLGRAYPRHIQGFNISPETYVEAVYDINTGEYSEPKEPHYTLDYETEGFKFRCYFLKKPIGLLPQLINYFFKKRDEYTNAYEMAIISKASEGELKKWERRQYNIKKTTNAIYGVMKFSKFRLHRKECTQATAIIGRIIIEELTKFLDSKGYILRYGDTDSIFVQLHSTEKEAMLKEGKWLEEIINEHLGKFFREKFGIETHADIGLKALYKKIKFFTKKHYASKYIWDEKKGWKEGYDFKGIASIRSDSSRLEKTALKQLLRMDLDETEPKIMEEYKEQVLSDFRARKYGPMDVAYPAQIKEKLEFNKKKGCWVTTYAKLDKNGRLVFSAHARAAIYSNMVLNTDFREGDKPRRLSVKLPKLIDSEQTTLFGPRLVQYPTTWLYKGKTGGIKKDLLIKVKDISIVEDMNIPQFFLDHIDWDRIEKRLIGKLNKVGNVKDSEESEVALV